MERRWDAVGWPGQWMPQRGINRDVTITGPALAWSFHRLRLAVEAAEEAPHTPCGGALGAAPRRRGGGGGGGRGGAGARGGGAEHRRRGLSQRRPWSPAGRWRAEEAGPGQSPLPINTPPINLPPRLEKRQFLSLVDYFSQKRSSTLCTKNFQLYPVGMADIILHPPPTGSRNLRPGRSYRPLPATLNGGGGQ